MGCMLCEAGCIHCAPPAPVKRKSKPVAERKLSPAQEAKRRRLAAPQAKQGATGVVDDTARALRALDTWDMLTPSEQAKHADSLRRRIPASTQAALAAWREANRLR